MNTTQRLHAMIAAVCPIEGVAILRNEQARIDYSEAATAEQRTAAETSLAAFDWSQDAHDAWLEDQHPERKSIRQSAAGAIQTNDTFLALTSPTAAQVREQVRALTQQNNRIIRRLIQLD